MGSSVSRLLYGYWRSSASYRVRIALNLKKLSYEHRGVHLVKSEQRSEAFLDMNPQGFVPLYVETSETAEPFRLSQSLAILDYLEAAYPERAILPSDAQKSAQIKALAQIIACDIHPLDNLRVLKYLEQDLGVEAEAKMAWYRHWVAEGFAAFEKLLPDVLAGQTFSLGDQPGYLEAVLMPQTYNAKRFDCPLDAFPNIVALAEACESLPEFIAAAPEQQPDATA